MIALQCKLRPTRSNAAVVACCAMWMALGCQGDALRVVGRGNVNALVDGRVDARVTATLPPVADAGPLVPMAVPGGGAAGGPVVAVVDVDGLLLNTDFTGLASLGENPVALFREQLDAVEANPCVEAVVVRINSPGGGVTATDILWHDLQALRDRTGLPVVACLMDVGAGGAYYLATASDRIVAHPTSVTGGIGVILNLYNLQDTMAQFNVVGVPVKSGSNIDLGSPIGALSDENRALLQAMADEFHARFRQVVLAARPEVESSRATTFDGRVFTAAQARDLKLIDSIGYLDDALAEARQLAGLERARTVFFRRPNNPSRSVYAVTPNAPLHGSLLPLSLPGLDRSRLPGFLYLWQPEPTLEKMSGR